MNYLCIASYILCSVSALWASASQQIPSTDVPFAKNTFQGQKITVENIASLMPPVPPRVIAAFKCWAESGDQPILLPQLLAFKHYPHALKQRWENDAFLQRNGYTNLSNGNYVFAFKDAAK